MPRKKQKPVKPKDKSRNFYLSDEIDGFVDDIADHEDLTRSAVIRRLVRAEHKRVFGVD